MYCCEQWLPRAVLRYAVEGTETQCAKANIRSDDSGKDNDRGGTAFVQVGDQGEPVFAVEVDVENDHVGLEAAGEVQGLAAGGRAAGDSHRFPFAFHERTYSGEDRTLVIHEQDFDRGGEGEAGHDGVLHTCGAGRDGYNIPCVG